MLEEVYSQPKKTSQKLQFRFCAVQQLAAATLNFYEIDPWSKIEDGSTTFCLTTYTNVLILTKITQNLVQ